MDEIDIKSPQHEMLVSPSNFENTFSPLKSEGHITVHQSSYRDDETNVLYKIVAYLIPAEGQKDEVDYQSKNYEFVKIVLHNISRKNRPKSQFMYPATLLMNDGGSEWVSSNYCKRLMMKYFLIIL